MTKAILLQQPLPLNVEPLTFEIDNEDFRTFAIRMHKDQRYGNFPYAIHLSMVENVLANHNFTDYKYRAAAWLHDVLEDTNTQYDTLKSLWGTEVALMVEACTGRGRNRKERNEDIYEKIKLMQDAAPIKVADRVANLRTGLMTRNVDKLGMYISEHQAFHDNIGKHMHETKNHSFLWQTLESYIAAAMPIVASFRLRTASNPSK